VKVGITQKLMHRLAVRGCRYVMASVQQPFGGLHFGNEMSSH